MKLIIGLGNPGKKYADTRHNVGFMVIDKLASKWGISLTAEKKFKGYIGTAHLNGEKIMLLKPTTYMNLSGESIGAVMDFYNLDDEDILVIYDDLDMESGKIRGRVKGSAGGHNGIKSTILHLASQEFKRLKIGIGKPVHGKVTDFVLGCFTEDELIDIMPAIDKATRACEQWLEMDFLHVINGLNQG